MGCIDRQPLSVAAIARTMGLTRQSVQRTADLLVQDGLAEYHENPHHRRAKLVQLTPRGLKVLQAIEARQVRWANDLGKAFAPQELEAARRVLDVLLAELDSQQPG